MSDELSWAPAPALAEAEARDELADTATTEAMQQAEAALAAATQQGDHAAANVAAQQLDALQRIGLDPTPERSGLARGNCTFFELGVTHRGPTVRSKRERGNGVAGWSGCACPTHLLAPHTCDHTYMLEGTCRMGRGREGFATVAGLCNCRMTAAAACCAPDISCSMMVHPVGCPTASSPLCVCVCVPLQPASRGLARGQEAVPGERRIRREIKYFTGE